MKTKNLDLLFFGLLILILLFLFKQIPIPPTIPTTDPSVVAVNPDQGAPNDTLDVTITGDKFQSGAASNFGAGITVNSTNFASDTQLTANIMIDGDAADGMRTVTVTNPDGQSGSQANAFRVGEVIPPPTVANASPNSGDQGRTLTVTVNGSNYRNGASANFGAGINVTATNFVSASRLRANIAIGGNAAPKPVSILWITIIKIHLFKPFSHKLNR